MIIFLIIFVISGLFFALLWYGKRIEMDGGRQFIPVGSRSMDTRLAHAYDRFRSSIRKMDAAYMKDKMHHLAENVERLSLKALTKLANRFGKLGDAVAGKHLPKNKGSVSFFLKHIESHKNQTKGTETHSNIQKKYTGYHRKHSGNL